MKKINESQLEKMISEIIKRTLKEDVYTPDNFYDEKKSFKQYAKDAKMPSNYDKGFNRNYNAGNDSEVDTADRALTLNKKDYETPEMKRAEKESDWANLEHQVDNFKSKAGKNASQYIDRHDDYFSKFNPNTDRDASKYSGMFDDEYWKGVNESKKQTKQTIRLTESQFNEVITKTIKKVLREEVFTDDVDEKIRILKSKIRSLTIQLTQATNSEKPVIREMLSELEAELNMLKTPKPQLSDKVEKIEDKSYSVSYISYNEEGATESSFELKAKNSKEAIDKALERANRGDYYVFSIYDRMAGKYIYSKNKGRGGYSIYDR